VKECQKKSVSDEPGDGLWSDVGEDVEAETKRNIVRYLNKMTVLDLST
jgi:hypothetical protein